MFIKEYLAMVLSIFCAFSNLDAAVNELSPGDAKFLKSCLSTVQASVSPSRYTSSIGVAVRSNFIKLSPAQIKDVLEDVDHDLLLKTPKPQNPTSLHRLLAARYVLRFNEDSLN